MTPIDTSVYRKCKELVEQEPTRLWTWGVLNDRLFELLKTDDSDGLKRMPKRSNWTRTELRSFLIHGPFVKVHVVDKYTAAPGFRRSRKRVCYKWNGVWEDAQEEE